MVPIKVVTIHDEHPDLSRRELHNVSRAAMDAMGRKWAGDLLPEHFEPGPQRAFGYEPRKPRYLKRKQKLFEQGAMIGGRRVIAGRNQDLVLTGRLRERVLATARNLIAAFPTRVTITMIGPPYFTLRPRRTGTARLAREVLAMSNRHERLLGESADRGFNAALRQVRASRRTRKVTTTT